MRTTRMWWLAMMALLLWLPSAQAFYDPNAQRWINRDPIGEGGGINLYGFVRNAVISYVDSFGLKCIEAKGKDGNPRITFSEPPPKGGWKMSRIGFFVDEKDDTYDGIGMVAGVKVKWTAEVVVLCLCDDGCYQKRMGTRVVKGKIDYEFFALRPGAGPVSIPTPTSLIEAIGEAAAAVVEESFGKPHGLSHKDVLEIGSRVAKLRPTKETDGSWKENKSPCD